MKKNVKILIIVCVAAALLAGLMCLLIFLPKGDGSSSSSSNGTATYDEGVKMSSSTDKKGVHQVEIKTNDKGEIDNNSYGTLMDYVPAKISKIHLENKKGTLDIKSYTPTDKDGKTEATQYTIVGYEDFDLQGGIADNIANNAASIEFSKVVTLDGSKAAEYGLDNPRDTVTVTYTDKTKSVIYVGDDAPQSAGTYIKYGDSDAVYLVTTDAVSAFDYGLTDLINKNITSAASDNDNTQASSIEISGSNFPDKIVLKPNDDGKNSASYVMTSPVDCYANENESSLVAGGIRDLTALSVEMVNPSDSQLSKVGLSTPYAKVKATYPDTTISLIASKPNSDNTVYLMVDGGKVVYTISAEKVSWVNTSYDSLVNEYVLYPKMSALSEVTVNDGSKTYTFSLSTAEKKTTDDSGSESTTTTTTIKNGNTEIETAIFSNFYENITMVELADTKSDSKSGSPVLTITYKYSSDSSTDTVSYYKSGSSRYVAVVNGRVAGHAYQSKVNTAIKQASKVAAGKSA